MDFSKLKRGIWVNLCAATLSTFRLLAYLLLITLIALFISGPTTYPQPGDQGEGSIPTETWTKAFHDDFEDPENRWSTKSDEDVSRSYDDGKYRIQVHSKGTLAWSALPVQTSSYDLKVEGTVANIRGKGSFGIFFRYQDSDNFYCLSIDESGRYKLELSKGGSFETIRGWTVCPGYREGSTNRFQLIALNHKIFLTVNDTQVESVTNDELLLGTVCLSAQARGEEGFAVSFEDLTIWRGSDRKKALEEKSDHLRARADHAYKTGDVERAVTIYKQLVGLFEVLQEITDQRFNLYYLSTTDMFSEKLDEGKYDYYKREIFSLLATCYTELGRPEEAAEYSKKGGQEMEEITNPWLLTAQARDAYSRGDLETALRLASKAYRVEMDTPSAGENPSPDKYGVEALLIIGGVHVVLGDRDKARSACSDALSFAYDLNAKELQARALLCLSDCDLAEGDLFYARVDLKNAIQLLSEAKNYYLAAKARLSLSRTQMLADDFNGAKATIQEARTEYLEAKGEIPTDLKADFLLHMAISNRLKIFDPQIQSSQRKSLLSQGISHLNSLLDVCREGGCNNVTIRIAHSMLGECLNELGEHHQAIDHLKQAIDLTEPIRGHIRTATIKEQYLKSYIDRYRDIVESLVATGEHNQSLYYAERSKSRTLVDMMETSMVLKESIFGPEVQTASHLIQHLSKLKERTTRPSTSMAAISPTNTRANSDRMTQQYEEEYQEIVTQLEQKHPELGATLSVDPDRLRDRFQAIQCRLGNGTIALEYFVTDEETIVWVISGQGVQSLHRIRISHRELANLVRSLRERINQPPSPGKEMLSHIKVLDKGRDLYDLLISPVSEEIKGAENLVIIPSDVLFYLPFEVLYRCPGCTGEKLLGGSFLIEDFAISYAPSLSALYWPFQHQDDRNFHSLLAVGNPTGDLPSAQKEVQEIGELFGEKDLLIHEEGGEKPFKDLLLSREYDVVHLSTHGQFDQQTPLLSHLLLRSGGGEDGALYAGEITGIDLSSNLVVLSACQTALPPDLTEQATDLVIGDELQGLSQSLFVAGAPSAVLTLWNVDDRSTRVLMEEMYRYLQTGNPKISSLRNAKLYLMNTDTYYHPYYWGPFVLYGVWR